MQQVMRSVPNGGTLMCAPEPWEVQGGGRGVGIQAYAPGVLEALMAEGGVIDNYRRAVGKGKEGESTAGEGRAKAGGDREKTRIGEDRVESTDGECSEDDTDEETIRVRDRDWGSWGRYIGTKMEEGANEDKEQGWIWSDTTENKATKREQQEFQRWRERRKNAQERQRTARRRRRREADDEKCSAAMRNSISTSSWST